MNKILLIYSPIAFTWGFPIQDESYDIKECLLFLWAISIDKNLFIYFILYTANVYATKVAVIDINYLIDNSIHFNEISKKINSSQIQVKENFQNTEENL